MEQLQHFKSRWQRFQYVECVLYAVGFGGLVYLLTKNLGFGLVGFMVAFGIALVLNKPWKIKTESVIAFVDAHVPEAGFSSGLLTLPTDQLSNLSLLQRHRVASRLKDLMPKLMPPHHLQKAALVMFGFILIGVLGRYVLGDFSSLSSKKGNNKEQIQFAPLDSIQEGIEIPELTETKITVAYPSYTGIPSLNTSNPNIKAVEGTQITWNLTFDGEVQEVIMDRMGELIPFSKNGEQYQLSQPLQSSGFYSFTFKDLEDNAYLTDLYSLEVTPDNPPMIEITDLNQYSYFEYNDDKTIPLNTQIFDDYGVNDAFIVATVSKGSGESVKFREETLQFDGSISKGNKQQRLKKLLDLSQLKMDPGDELYFYVEAQDNKTPTPNIARSETYFAVIRDTVTDEFAVEGNLGVDLMPDYFRSQRQLIIDTEKLIQEQPDISEYDFKFRSNELGFDQKSLRLKYGQFMGDETELQDAPGQVSAVEEETHTDEDGEEKDILDGYSHKHDSENEHNLVVEHPEKDEEEEEDPLHEYLHNHSDPEESTLFEKSLKAQLRDALNIMWDAELYLRLYQPEKSLPYQYQALEIIQEIKNSARIYVHRIGFDPPPIKEETRLTGDIENIKNVDKNESFEYEMTFAATRKMVARLETLINGNSQFTKSDNTLVLEAGNELAQKAVSEPVKYLKVLQGLRDLEKTTNRTKEMYVQVQKNILSVLPKVESNPGKGARSLDEINLLYLKELGDYE
ncbi:DUF4175 family protein [Flagellimonas zhangzhouensis]|uniref:Tryptophan-rich sensory protein n=1 Tax=Flagellimonas zhangzhouensis TaxID=1073328 RepID=A0A1H2Y7Y7_9FLAO|nr:DUF4175 family protein [Allomuricauda zhangzhouensis]SDQ98521.1 hypothetical protein SAMN05216294_3062 [Allomuricauda zhangzhouensis]SDX01257.1 hypothetical protein SAMN04487892_2959 [Allomuricauda zhangzhouensis]